jgi:hypothetical protein
MISVFSIRFTVADVCYTTAKHKRVGKHASATVNRKPNTEYRRLDILPAMRAAVLLPGFFVTDVFGETGSQNTGWESE